MIEIMEFDTDLMPKLAENIKLNREVKDNVPFLIVEFNAREYSGDPLISIVADDEYNRSIINNLQGRIIGSGTSAIAIPALMYGLQHPTRLLYKDTISGINDFLDKYLKDKFTKDDEQLRETLNTIRS